MAEIGLRIRERDEALATFAIDVSRVDSMVDALVRRAIERPSARVREVTSTRSRGRVG